MTELANRTTRVDTIMNHRLLYVQEGDRMTLVRAQIIRDDEEDVGLRRLCCPQRCARSG